MGYYTRYETSIERATNAQVEQLNNEFNKFLENRTQSITEDSVLYQFSKDSNLKDLYSLAFAFAGDDTMKGYTVREDMLLLSRYFPQYLFVLEGEGEESGDIWKEYFLNGKSQHCSVIMTFEPFDEKKLS